MPFIDRLEKWKRETLAYPARRMGEDELDFQAHIDAALADISFTPAAAGEKGGEGEFGRVLEADMLDARTRYNPAPRRERSRSRGRTTGQDELVAMVQKLDARFARLVDRLREEVEHYRAVNSTKPS